MGESLGVKSGIALLITGGIVLWNAWIFGFLNHGLAGYTQMSISELNVSGEPFSRFFTGSEWLSGLLLLLGGLVLLYSIRKVGYFMLIALVLTILIGGLTIFDAAHPLECNRYQNPTCSLKWARGEVTSNQKEHGIESQTTNYVTIVLSIELVIWVLHQKLFKGERSYLELGLVALLAVATIAPLLISSSSIVTESIGQRIWNTLTSVLFLYIIYRVQQADRAASVVAHSQRKTRKAIA